MLTLPDISSKDYPSQTSMLYPFRGLYHRGCSGLSDPHNVMRLNGQLGYTFHKAAQRGVGVGVFYTLGLYGNPHVGADQ